MLLEREFYMSSQFSPIDEVQILCRFCGKITEAHLDRCIAGNGKVVDRNSVFEYYCTRCMKTFCFSGTDILEQRKGPLELDELRHYAPSEHFFIGEVIHHKQFKESGTVVGNDHGSPSKIVVNFPKNGLRKLVQDM